MERYWLRGIRGATSVDADERGLILTATEELLSAMLENNGVETYEMIAGIFFTSTPDLVAAFPAEAARNLGLSLVPLLCFQEIPVPGAIPHVVRVMMQVNTSKKQDEIKHIYLRQTRTLRPDLAKES
jgi:chorismate mutase